MLCVGNKPARHTVVWCNVITHLKGIYDIKYKFIMTHDTVVVVEEGSLIVLYCLIRPISLKGISSVSVFQ